MATAKFLPRLLIFLVLLSLCHCKSSSSRSSSHSKKKSRKHEKVKKIAHASKPSDITSRELRKRKRKENKAKKKAKELYNEPLEMKQDKMNDLYLSNAVLSTDSTQCLCKTKASDADCDCDHIFSLSVMYLGDIDASVIKVFDTFTKQPRCKFNGIITSGHELICEAGDDDDVFSDSTTFKLKRKDGTTCVAYADTSCKSYAKIDSASDECDDIIVSRYISDDENICDYGLSPCKCDDEQDEYHVQQTNGFTSTIARLITQNMEQRASIFETGEAFTNVNNGLEIDLNHDMDESTPNPSLYPTNEPSNEPSNKPTNVPSHKPVIDDDVIAMDVVLDSDANNLDLAQDLYHESMEPIDNKAVLVAEEALIHIESQAVNADTQYSEYTHIEIDAADAYSMKTTEEESRLMESDEDNEFYQHHEDDDESSYDYLSESYHDYYSDEESESYESLSESETDHESIHHSVDESDDKISSESDDKISPKSDDKISSESTITGHYDEDKYEVIDEEMNVIQEIDDMEEDKKLDLSHWSESFVSLKNKNELRSSSGSAVYPLYGLCAVLLAIVVMFVFCLYKKGMIKKHMIEEQHTEAYDLEACVSIGSETDFDDLTADEDEYNT